MTPVKKTAKKVEAAAVEEVKAAVEETLKAAAAKKAPAKKAAAKAEPKKAAAKPAAKPAAKKTAAKKAAAPEANVYIEFQGGQIAAKSILEKAVASYTAAHAGSEIKTIELYIQPEVNKAFYVVNGEGAEDFFVEL